jgi:hypothetical protein
VFEIPVWFRLGRLRVPPSQKREAIVSDLNEKKGKSTTALSQWPFFEVTNSAVEYWVAAQQRAILLLDVLRQHGNNCIEHNAYEAPHVLNFDVELVLVGRLLPRPVNYALVRIVPPKALRSIRANGRSSFSTRVPATVPASAA